MDKVEHIKRILNSFEKLTGNRIIVRKSPKEDFVQIENGQFVLVSHNGAKDPILNYGNQCALKLWEMTWDEFVKTPSRKTAEADIRKQRSEILSIVSKQGYYSNYESIRISSTGKQFKIKNAVIWNVSDENDLYIGQAAYFDKIQYLV